MEAGRAPPQIGEDLAVCRRGSDQDTHAFVVKSDEKMPHDTDVHPRGQITGRDVVQSVRIGRR